MVARRQMPPGGTRAGAARPARGAGAPEAEPPQSCRSCGRSLARPADVGWECECGVVVCGEPGCFEDYFKFVAGGEGTRCLTCGALV